MSTLLLHRRLAMVLACSIALTLLVQGAGSVARALAADSRRTGAESAMPQTDAAAGASRLRRPGPAVPDRELETRGGEAALYLPQLLGDHPLEARQTTWTNFSTGNDVRDVAVDARRNVVWAATSGGALRWDAGTGAHYLYTTSDGLESADAYAVLIDHSGEVWIGGNDGISQLASNGKSWTRHGRQAGLPAGEVVTSIAEDRSGSLWFATLYQGALRLAADRQTWSRLSGREHPGLDGVRKIAVDGAGRVWFGTRKSGVVRLNPVDNTFDTVTMADGLLANDVAAMAFDGAGNIWVGSYGGASRYSASTGKWSTFTSAGTAGLYGIDDIVVAVDGSTWFATGSIMQVSRDLRSWTYHDVDHGGPLSPVTALAAGANGTMWAGTLGKGLLQRPYGSSNWTQHPTRHNLRSNRVLAVTLDDNRDLWLGTGDGAYRLSARDRSWTRVDPGDPRLGNEFFAIVIGPNGDRWLLSDNGVMRSAADGTTSRTYVREDGYPLDSVRGMVFDRSGAAWFATPSGVARLSADGGTWTLYSEADGLVDDFVTSIVMDANGALWFAALNGVSRLSPDQTTWTTYTEADGLARNLVSRILLESDGSLWFATRGGGVSHLSADQTTWTSYSSTDGLVDNDVTSVAVDDLGNRWFGTLGGVSRLSADGRSWSTYTAADGLASNQVSAITTEADGTVWIGTSSGLSRLGFTSR